MFLFIKLIFFPALSFAFATQLPIVVVESCSMYHESEFNTWWEHNALWYKDVDILREEFEKFPFRNGLNKGDIVFVSGRGDYEVGDIIIFSSSYTYPLIHRIISENPLETKGDHNFGQLAEETEISKDAVLGKAVGRVPGAGWIKLVFFEANKPRYSRGFCR